jgi:hypothetical protein
MTDDSGNVTSDSGKLPKIGHDKTECAVTIIQNRRSRSNGMGGHDRAEYAVAAIWTTGLKITGKQRPQPGDNSGCRT